MGSRVMSFKLLGNGDYCISFNNGDGGVEVTCRVLSLERFIIPNNDNGRVYGLTFQTRVVCGSTKQFQLSEICLCGYAESVITKFPNIQSMSLQDNDHQRYLSVPQAMRAFFMQPRTICVGMKMGFLKKQLLTMGVDVRAEFVDVGNESLVKKMKHSDILGGKATEEEKRVHLRLMENSYMARIIYLKRT